MIGFGSAPNSHRRPIYSVTGQKLCYVEVGPEGEWIYTVDGLKVAKLTRRHKQFVKDLAATTNACGGAMLYPEEHYEW